MLFFPCILNNVKTSFHLLLIQSFIALFGNCAIPVTPIFYKHFPIFKRFTYSSLIYALSHSFMYIITSFGLIYLTDYLGTYGLLVIMIPMTVGYFIGLNHFENLEKQAGNYPHKNSFDFLVNET